MKRLILFSLILIAPLAGLAMFQDAADPIARLQAKLDSGESALRFDSDRGYISSVLKELGVPVSSQGLVFSKSSFQLDLISPSTPRAIYFNDDVYVGYVQGGELLEFASVDPRQGILFYTLEQKESTRPRFVRETGNCLICHVKMGSKAQVAELTVRSVLTDRNGNSIVNLDDDITNDRSPLEKRWGGWYISGTHGNQLHMGNVTSPLTRYGIGTNMQGYLSRIDKKATANITDLATLFDPKPYLSKHSDIVALMVMTHQAGIHNLIAIVNHNPAIRENVDKLVNAMLFVREAPLTAPITGTSGFAEGFVQQGPRDSRGRSLRDLDFKKRMFRYPLSYVVYSDAFNALPDSVKQYAYGRFRDARAGSDTLQILQETKPDFAEFIRTR